MPERKLTPDEKFGEAMDMIKKYWRVEAKQGLKVTDIGTKFIGYVEDLDCIYLQKLLDQAMNGGFGRGTNAYFLNMLNPIYRGKNCNEGR